MKQIDSVSGFVGHHDAATPDATKILRLPLAVHLRRCAILGAANQKDIAA